MTDAIAPTKEPIRILLVDDSQYFLDATRDFLNQHNDLRVVHTATDEHDGLAKCVELKPHVVLLDLNLASRSGLQLIPLFRRELPSVQIIVLTMMEESGYRAAAVKAGADGFVQKTSMSKTLVPAIFEAMQHGAPLPAAAYVSTAEPNQVQLQFLRLAELLPDLIYRYELTPALGFSYVSPSAAATTGYTPSEFYADPQLWLNIVHPDDRQMLQDFRQGGAAENNQMILRCARKDGTMFWLEQRSVPIYDTSGNLIAVEGIARDITERQSAQSAAEESEQRSLQLIKVAERQARDLALLDRVRTVIARELDLPTLLMIIVESIAETFGYTLVSLYLLEKEEMILQHQVGYEHVFDRINLSQGVTGRVVRNGRAELIEDVTNDPDFLGAVEGIVSEIAVPLFDKGQVTGFLNVESTHGIRLNEDDLKLLIALSEQINIAISRARLYGDSQRRGNILAALQESTLAIMGELQLKEVLHSILEHAASLMGTSHGYLYLAEPGLEKIRIDVGIGLFEAYVDTELGANEGVAGKVWKTAQPLNVEDYTAWAGQSSLFTGTAFHAVVGVPLISGNHVTGVLGLARLEAGNPFREEDVELLAHFARLASIAMENARLYSQAKEELAERRQAEAALRAAEENYRSLVENTLEGIGRSTLDGKMLAANPALCRLNGYKSETELIAAVNDIALEWYVEPQRREAFISILLERGELANFESEIYRHATRERIWINESARLIRNEAGEALWIEATIQDITERKHAEQALEEARSFLQQVVDSSPGMIFVKDANGRAVFVNQYTADYYGTTAEQLVSKATAEVHQSVKEAKEFVTDDDEVIRTRRRIEKDELNTAPDGAEHWFHTVKVPLLRPDGSVHVLGISTDITDRKEAEKKNRAQVERLTALREIDKAISSSFDMRMSLNLLLSRAATLLSVDAVSVLHVNPIEFTLEYGAGLGFRTEMLRTESVKFSDSYAGIAATEQRVVKLPNLENEPTNRFKTGFLMDEHFVGYYGAPLIVKGKVVGVLEAFHRSVVERDQDWLDFFVTLAGQAAIAIDNAKLFQDLQRSNQDLGLAYEATIEGWSRALDLRDKETEGHTLRVTEKTIELARLIGLPDEQLLEIRRGALLHDIGKMGVPDAILLKSGSLTADEWELMRMHPSFAFELLAPIRYLKASAIDIPYCHHEKWDGSGYPRGLKGEQIPLAARIFAIVDVWDALTSDRPYRPAWEQDRARAHIQSLAGTHFDPRIVEVCLESGILSRAAS